MKPFNKIFKMHTKLSVVNNGYRISCKKGLWSVESKELETVEKEARHYFYQYYKDGEYDKRD